jgi:ATP dependent DNA ligase domain
MLVRTATSTEVAKPDGDRSRLIYHWSVFLKFIEPCHPQRATTVPAGDDWQHEIKFDGFRVQIHKLGDDVELYSRNGSRFSRRFPRLVEVLRKLPVKSAIIDGEIVASDVRGMPDFWRLFLRSENPAELHVWAFDLLALNSKDLRKWSLEARRGRLQTLLSRFRCPTVLCSEPIQRRPGAAPRGREARPRGRGKQAPGCALPLWQLPWAGSRSRLTSGGRPIENGGGYLSEARERNSTPSQANRPCRPSRNRHRLHAQPRGCQMEIVPTSYRGRMPTSPSPGCRCASN